MDSVVDPAVAAAFEALRAAVEDVMGLDLDRVPGADVVALVGVAERETRRLQASSRPPAPRRAARARRS